MIKLAAERFVTLKEFAGTGQVFGDTAKRYQRQHDVGRLHELQRCELYRRHFAAGHRSQQQHRKHAIHSWNKLYGYEKSPGSREGVIRHGQGDSKLASTGESGQTLTSIILSCLSCALPSQSTEKELYAKRQTSKSFNVKISNEDEQSLRASTGARANVPSGHDFSTADIQRSNNANITYPIQRAANLKRRLPKRKIGTTATNALQSRNPARVTFGVPIKEANRTRDGIRREFSNILHISAKSPATTNEQVKENEEKNDETEGEPDREGKSLADSRNGSNTESEVVQKQHDDTTNGTLSVAKERSVESTAGEISGQVNVNMIAKTRENSADAEVKSQTLRDRADQRNWESQEDGLMKAANFGLQAMHDLYYIQEPKLYSMGLYLDGDNPARYVAAFNDQSEEARNLARFGYAALQGTAMLLKKFPNALLELSLSRSSRRTSLEQRCPRRNPPQCPPASLRYRTSDGSCNNLQNLWWGSAMSTMQRYLPPEYHDGVQSIRRSANGRALPNPRDVTNLIHEDRDVPLASITHMLMQWGQFVDHDLTATGQSRGFNGTVPQCCLQRSAGFQPPEFMHPECLPIAVTPHDSFYGPLGVRCLEFLRSGPAPKENCEFGPREQLSQVTSYLDASMIYSSNAMHSDSLRIFRNGLLQYGRIQSRRPVLPRGESDLCKRGSLSTTCFRAGDGRLSEQPALTSLHVAFLRLHNKIAAELSGLNSHWSDEKLFQETRRIVGSIVQHITYREFLPIVLGPQVMKIFDLEILKKGYYEGYDPTVNPTVANSFATAAYRFGHSLVQRSFVRFDSDHRPIFNNVSIHEEFSNPVNLETVGSVDRLLLGLVNQPCQRRDEFISGEITNHLFQTPAFAFGMDLASLNIQRGRDHGLPPYTRWREPCGLSPIRTFEDLGKVMSPSAVSKFRSLYSSVNDIDLFPAGLAEKSVVGGLVGPTFACIIGQQFSNLRRGDRFWYENPEGESSYTVGQLQQIKRVTLARILCHTMDDIKTIQPFVFLAADTLKNQRRSCDDARAIGHLDLEFWAERPSEFRNAGVELHKVKRTTTATSSDSVSREGNDDFSPRKRVGSQQGQQTRIVPQKPFESSVNQNNRIVVKRPFGRPDDNNVTIVVQNNAWNSPIFVNDGIYGSHVKIQPTAEQPPIAADFNQAANNYPQPYRPQVAPTTIPHSSSSHAHGHPYRPHAYNDPSNPNPLAYGYRFPISVQDRVFYDNYSPTSPRPTLYTYYTNFQQQKPPTTELPDREVDGYLIYYGSPDHDSTHSKPTINPGYFIHESNDKQTAAQWPGYDESQLPSNLRPSHFEPSHEQGSDHSTPKPALYSAIPGDEMHYQKPAHHVPPTNSQQDSRPNYQSYGTDKPSTGSLQGNDFNDGQSENYPANPNKPLHQEQWNSDNYQKRPNDRPYDQDDPDAYQKRPNIKLSNYNTGNINQAITINRPNNEYNSQSWKTNSPNSAKNPIQSGLYGPVSNFETTDAPFYEKKGTSFELGDPNNVSPASRNDYNRYPDTTPAYRKTSTSTQNSWSVSSYVKESHARPAQSESFNPHAPYEKPTSHPIHEKDDQLLSYANEPIDKSVVADPYKHDDSYKNPTHKPFGLNGQVLSTFYQDKDHSDPTSTTDFHWQKEIQKPMRVQSVTIATEIFETVHHPGQSGYVSQRVTSDVPKPLAQRIKSNVAIVRKPGQYYYEKNVLHRYPDGAVRQIPKSNYYSADGSKETFNDDRGVNMHEKITTGTSLVDEPVINARVIPNDESKLTTAPMAVIDDDGGDDLQRAFSADVDSVAPTDIPNRTTNHWTNLQEDSNLSSTLEMPEISSDEFASARELPKPIRLRGHAA